MDGGRLEFSDMRIGRFELKRFKSMNRLLGYETVYLPLYKGVLFHIQGDKMCTIPHLTDPTELAHKIGTTLN